MTLGQWIARLRKPDSCELEGAPDRESPLAVEILEERIALSFTAMGTNPFGFADVGNYAIPAFVDIDGDGDQDAFIGNVTGNTRFFRNTGTNAAPAFSNVGSSPFGLANVGASAAPAFVDIDGDGDQDVFIGNNAGNTLFFRNTGTATAPAFSNVGSNPFGLANVGSYATPTFVDVDGDGDQDAFIGNQAGNTRFFRNTGTNTAPAFSNVGSNPFGLADVGSYAAPTFVDIDSDGDQDAFIGNFPGNTRFFRNTGTSTAPAFSNVGSNPFGLADVGSSAAPRFVDIDADGDLDAFIGNRAGNTLFFQASAVIGVTGNGMAIANGMMAPSIADGTDFDATVIGTTVARTFAISNTDAVTGLFSNITITGANPGDFSVTTAPASPVIAGGMTTFVVTFSPTAVGTRSATISIAHSDNSETPFTFAVQGTASAPPMVTPMPSVTLVDGLLTAIFTPGDEVGTFSGSDDAILLDVNGTSFGPFSGVDSIVVNTQEGDDQIKILDPINLPFQIDGGPGTDTLDLSAVNASTFVELGQTNLIPSEFTSIENILTGAGNDTFIIHPNAMLDGAVDGGGGFNTLDFSRLSGPLFIDLQAGQFGGLTFANIQQGFAPLFYENVVIDTDGTTLNNVTAFSIENGATQLAEFSDEDAEQEVESRRFTGSGNFIAVPDTNDRSDVHATDSDEHSADGEEHSANSDEASNDRVRDSEPVDEPGADDIS